MNQLNSNFIKKLRFDKNGLIPAIAQDWLDGAILMMAWMNADSLEQTMKTGEVHYWSRSRNELWHKGATSGHTQLVKEIRYDCDADVILLIIEQTGQIACHTGARSCFFEKLDMVSNQWESKQMPTVDACGELFKVIDQRRLSPEPESYTNKLFNGGDNSILKKVGEESAEFIMACKDNDSNSIKNEAADLIFHLQVALSSHDVSWKDVQEVLARRRNMPRRS